MTKVGIITQARMTSARLPGKVLLEADNCSMLEHHLNRLSAVGVEVVVATTTNEADDPIEELANQLGFSVFRGSEDDVLSRFAGAACHHGFDVVVRVTSDCPLIDGELVKEGIDAFLALGEKSAFVSNTLERTYPRGMDFEVFSAESLFDADVQASAQAEREHVTPRIHSNSARGAMIRQVTRGRNASRYRITLDTEEDLSLILTLIERYSAAHLDVEQLIELFEKHPELAQINAAVEQKQLGD